jgi:hypothetical protein
MASVNPSLSLFPAKRTAGKCLAFSTKNIRVTSNLGTGSGTRHQLIIVRVSYLRYGKAVLELA